MESKPHHTKFWINVGYRLENNSTVFPLNACPLELRTTPRGLSADQIKAFEKMLELAEKLAPGESHIVSDRENFVTSIYRTNEV